MRVQIAPATPQQLEAHLRASFPRYSVAMRAGMPLVGDGAATGVLVKPSGPGAVTLAWAFPSMGVQILVTLAIVLTGLLPGLLLFLVVWLSVKGGVARLKTEVSSALTGGVPPVQAALPHAGAVPGRSARFVSVAGVIASAMGLVSLVQLFVYVPGSSGIIGALCWLAIGAGTLLRASQETKGEPSGPGLLVMGVASIVQAVLTLSHAFRVDGFVMVRALYAGLFWLATGGLLLAANAKKGPPASVMLRVLGGALALLGLLNAYDVYVWIDYDWAIGLPFVLTLLRIFAFFGLAACAFGRAAAKVDAAQQQQQGYAPSPQPAYPQQQYPQQQYPQQQYPQQQYPTGNPPGGGWPQA